MPVTAYLPAPGNVVPPENCVLEKTRETVKLTHKLPFHHLVETRVASDASFEVVVIDMEIEVPQRTVHDIHRLERIAITYYQQERALPEVLALREDFPEVPHLNLRESEKPRSLCIYEDKFAEVMLRWTSVSFLERVREWLALTAVGELHAADQPLEPLISSAAYIVLPEGVFAEGGQGHKQLTVTVRDDPSGVPVFVAETGEGTSRAGGPKYVAYFMTIPPVVHGVVNRLPTTIAALHALLESAGFDFLGFLKEALYELKYTEGGQDVRPIFIIRIPKCRNEGEPEESQETLAFLSRGSVADIGIDIGIWERFNGTLAARAVLAVDSSRGANIEIAPVVPLQPFSRPMALSLSGIETASPERNITLVGAGALGSQFISAVVRMGLGKWTVIDDDHFMPHNLGRHLLDRIFVGSRKSRAVAYLLDPLFSAPADETVKHIAADVMAPRESEKDKVRQALQHAEFIVDASTSVPAARFLGLDAESPARRISIFLSPSGRDSVMLAEPADRNITLDLLEMQYYRTILQHQCLHDHLHRDESGRIRYARSCRDISFVLPQDQVVMHAGLCSKAFRLAFDDPAARAVIWKSGEDGSVETIEVDIHDVKQYRFGEWTVCFDTFVTTKISAARADRLPKETGGVLLGCFDQQRKIVYVVDTILSPPDSIEWPTTYIRGCEGLPAEVERIGKMTAGMIGYVGEWHSHPGASTRPSQDDLAAFAWLVDLMEIEGRPALMVIAGEENLSWFLGKMIE